MSSRAPAMFSSQHRSTEVLCECCMRLVRRTAGNVESRHALSSPVAERSQIQKFRSVGEETRQLFQSLLLPLHLPPDGGVVVVPDSAHSDTAALGVTFSPVCGQQRTIVPERGLSRFITR